MSFSLTREPAATVSRTGTLAEPVSYAHRGEIHLEKGERRRLASSMSLRPRQKEPLPLSASQIEDEPQALAALLTGSRGG